LVNWIVTGYAAKVLRESPGGDAPPKLEKYGDMFVDGAKIFFASLIYMIIPLILIGAGVGSLIAGFVTAGGPDFILRGFTPAQMFLFGGAGITLVLVGLLVAFLMLIILAAGIAHMIKTGRFGKAFAFGEILGLIGKVGWGKYLVWVILVAIIAFIVGAVVGVIPYVGWLIGALGDSGRNNCFHSGCSSRSHTLRGMAHRRDHRACGYSVLLQIARDTVQ